MQSLFATVGLGMPERLVEEIDVWLWISMVRRCSSRPTCPTWGRAMREFEAAMEEVHNFLATRQKRTVFIGMDANTKLNGTTDFYHAGAQIPRATLLELDRDRAKAVHAFATEHILIAANTWMDAAADEQLFTRTKWDGKAQPISTL